MTKKELIIKLADSVNFHYDLGETGVPENRQYWKGMTAGLVDALEMILGGSVKRVTEELAKAQIRWENKLSGR